MASLGAVYGISFIAGSLASMGSAYMASNIYKIEDEESVEPPMEAGMYGGVDPINNPMYKRPINYEKAVRKEKAVEVEPAKQKKLREEKNRNLRKNWDETLTAEENRDLRKKWDEKIKAKEEEELKAKEEKEKEEKEKEEKESKARAEAQAEADKIAEAEAKKLAEEQATKRIREAPEEERIAIRKNWGLAEFQKEKELSDKEKEEADRLLAAEKDKIEADAKAEKAEAERLLTQSKIKEEKELKAQEEAAAKDKAEADAKAEEKRLLAEAEAKARAKAEAKAKAQEEADKIAETDSSFLDIKTAVEFFNSVISKNQKGGAGDTKLFYDIIENGPFGNDNKSLITWNKLNELKPIIIAFSMNEVGFPDTETEFDGEMIKINKRRAAKVLTVISWLRTVPNKTNITEKDIGEIVPDLLSLKQLIDILSNMIKLDDKKKQNIQINKKTFSQETDVILPVYVLDDTIKILTNNLSDKIQIKDLIKYFKSDGTLYTFFKYKNILRLTYDYTLGNIDKIIINLSKVIDWLETTTVNKITNADIERFLKQEVSGGVSRTTRPEKNRKNKNQIPSRPTFQPPTPFRFTAPAPNPQEPEDIIMDEQLPAPPVVPVQAPAPPIAPAPLQAPPPFPLTGKDPFPAGTTPPGTARFPDRQRTFLGTVPLQFPAPAPFQAPAPAPAPAPGLFTFTNNDPFQSQVPRDKSILVETLFFLINERVQVKSKFIRVTDFNAIETLDPDNVDKNTKIISWLIDPSRATLPKPTKEQYSMILKELGLSKIDKTMMKVPTLFVGPIVLPDIDPKTEGTDQNVPEEYTQAIPLLEKIEGVIEKRGESIKEFSKKSKEYDKTIREKESKEYMKGTESEKNKKLFEAVKEKDQKIKELEENEKRLKEDAVLKEAAKKVFDERLKKAVEKQNLKEMEALLKERDVELSKEYETVKKESENRNKGLVKPPNLDQKIWDKTLSEVKAITDPLKLPEYITNFKTANPAVDISPFTDVGKMINAIYSSKQSRGNAPPGTKTCKETSGRPPCFSEKQGKMITGGGRTLHNRLRNSRYFTRRNV